MTFILQAIITFFLTVVAGTWLSGMWQERTARQQRYHEALRSRYERIDQTIQNFTNLAGARIYRTQRLVLNYPDQNDVDKCRRDLADSIVQWNESMMGIEVSIKSHFRESYLDSLEFLQNSFSAVTSSVLRKVDQQHLNKAAAIEELRMLRHECHNFIRGMVEEAKKLDREMHFGVRVGYDTHEIGNWSTKDLFKALFLDLKQTDSIVRPPSDFGSPVKIRDTRFGVDQH